jgi:hypothetical protein
VTLAKMWKGSRIDPGLEVLMDSGLGSWLSRVSVKLGMATKIDRRRTCSSKG